MNIRNAFFMHMNFTLSKISRFFTDKCSQINSIPLGGTITLDISRVIPRYLNEFTVFIIGIRLHLVWRLGH
jgi:hypothetical protein